MCSNRESGPFGLSRRRFLQSVGAGTATALVAPGTARSQIQIDPEIPGRPTVPIRLRVNGSVYRVTVEPRFTLLDVLRNQLDLTGAKRVCDRGECGACTVHVDGKPVRSCMILAVDAQTRDIQTVESLSADGRLHPLQEAFVRHDAFQCGFCTPGMVMSLKGLLDQNVEPTLAQVKAAIGGNLCKCGTYPKIFLAVQDAAQVLKGRS